jgi:ABC-type dipeptide/oligopeptide/nickel transport system permease subunit
MPWGKRFATLCTAFVFGIFHGNLLQTPFAFVVGLVLGYVACEYNIVWAMILHMVNNLVLGDMLPRLTSGMPEMAAALVMWLILLISAVVSVVVLILSPGFWSMVFALTVTGWISVAYFIRTQVLVIRDREYNLASRCLGTPITRIAMKNILPFMTSVIVTLAATEIPSYISYEVFLSYIGIGMKDRSLGLLINNAQSAMVTPGWGFEFWSPVAVASIIAVVLYLVGQNLGDASDPRTHM